MEIGNWVTAGYSALRLHLLPRRIPSAAQPPKSPYVQAVVPSGANATSLS
jgi:hypothetical protein